MDHENLLKKVNKIWTASERCKLIVDDLLAFSRQSHGAMGLVSLAEVVDKTCDLFARQFRQASVAVRRDVPADLPIWGNADQLQQVLTNIALNALQAMEHEGTLSITARPAEAGFVSLEIHDDGPGIPPDHLEKIFDPFFTTKPMGQGTGLGLSIAYGLVRNHGGQISVDSPAGDGTTFVVSLPVESPGQQSTSGNEVEV
jgi:two-component system NtrC family sensor kinase